MSMWSQQRQRLIYLLFILACQQSFFSHITCGLFLPMGCMPHMSCWHVCHMFGASSATLVIARIRVCHSEMHQAWTIEELMAWESMSRKETWENEVTFSFFSFFMPPAPQTQMLCLWAHFSKSFIWLQQKHLLWSIVVYSCRYTVLLQTKKNTHKMYLP